VRAEDLFAAERGDLSIIEGGLDGKSSTCTNFVGLVCLLRDRGECCGSSGAVNTFSRSNGLNRSCARGIMFPLRTTFSTSRICTVPQIDEGCLGRMLRSETLRSTKIFPLVSLLCPFARAEESEFDFVLKLCSLAFPILLSIRESSSWMEGTPDDLGCETQSSLRPSSKSNSISGMWPMTMYDQGRLVLRVLSRRLRQLVTTLEAFRSIIVS
jgi:hypothetical protein